MPALIERHKMSLAMWSALKSHIMKQREKKKQGNLVNKLNKNFQNYTINVQQS